ncbi:MAG: DNA polymerase III subunit delta [Pseudorhodoplanes sp.]|jgi:DNA polymerase-3 subunit delta|nr:DNA polymerase III subunit delta [Pseudorhodoplanes sp.]
MVALKSRDADAFLARPDAARSVVLIYGPDAGLVRERIDTLVKLSVNNADDPFSFVRIDGDDLASDPQRLIEEASTIPLFGGRRAILVRTGSRNIAPAVEPLLSSQITDCRVLIEAGDLKRNAPLRTLCERAKTAAVIACYADDDRSLGRLLDDELRAAKLTIAPDARAALLPLLGGDRRATRGEIQKLILYVTGRDRVTLDDVLNVIADASAEALDGIVDSAFTGKLADVETEFAKARAAGTHPGVILSAALRQLSQVHKLRLAADAGQGIAAAVESARPPIHFSRKAQVEMAVKSWSGEKLLQAMQQLARAVLDSRRQPMLAETIAQRTLMSLATAARQRK